MCTAPNVVPLTIRLSVGLHERSIVLPVDKTIHLGRIDSALGVFPEIDFTPDGPEARSVSRRHASISRTSKGILVEDLGSVTGTFVNSERLSPFLPEILDDGDELQLGKLRVSVGIN
ncbi:MAG TPA: FHA domain-containing protein [Anaerolineae bacterium]|mgnify:CR=1 FL=1|nr:FHA domain-containing protein [Anaerolineae bacterium]MCB0179379.1 FHA domain-containing protein [Anaerolineae bacterium]MCB0222626.1 FHA domain-containing protein [Anaerolineae bacterium]MCB9106949.1 FHA domain-containing protein [Anaerolineales bacterium]HRV96335.1 FHA domain-containing protein [Anaerolineae bacterium]